ncbi:hypothetical protein [Streptomyces lasalocidi]|uniref:Secreted protein n=1 Tax=Streptomyces lasalocidi TaxID=324833 RepID=A0A4U5W883_STRLS|nr:hypothetical protein [Streptomyces lasalocidi]TKS96365.1 hypothetical protein E4U91_37500 [Streptomyces lasalocidi]
MFLSQKTAAAAAFVGSLAALCLGATHAVAEGKAGDCPTRQEGVTCVQRGESYIDEDGTHVIKQEQQCETTDRPNVVTQQDQLFDTKPVTAGAKVDCSNTAKLPEGFRRPDIGI